MNRQIFRTALRSISAALLLGLLLGLFPAGSAQAERWTTTPTAWWWFKGTTLSQLQDKVAQGYRITDLEIDDTSPFRVSATLVKNSGDHAKSWWWYYGVSIDVIVDKVNQHKARIIDLETYVVNGSRKYAVVMVGNTGAEAKGWWWYVNLNSIQAVSDKLNQHGARLIDIDTFVSNGNRYYNVVMIPNSGADASAWWWYVNVSPQVISQKLDEHKARLIDIEGHGDGTFTVIMEKNDSYTWWWYYNISTVNQIKHLTTKHNARVIDIEPYTTAGQQRYAVILLPNGAVPKYDIPVRGKEVPELNAFDDAMVAFMQARDIPGGTLAVMKDGEVVLERGYGWKDQAETTAMPANALLRLASVSKPFTAAVIHKLAAENQLNLSDRAFCLPGSPNNCHLNLTPWPNAAVFDARLRNITIQHLLDHEGGWDRSVSGDPMFKAKEIANDMGVASPPSQTNIVRWVLGKSLDFAPGSTSEYSNFGYLLLGLIAEDVTGQNFTTYLQNEIMNPLGVADSELTLGRTVAALANPREPYYKDSDSGGSVYPPYNVVACPYGCWDLEPMEAHGGLIASARAVVEFLDGYWISGQPRDGNGQSWAFFGSLDGTWTMARQRSDGINIVALFNQRSDPSGLDYAVIKDILDQAADGISTWPSSSSPTPAPKITFNHALGAPGSFFSLRMRGLEANESYRLEIRRSDRQGTLLRTVELNTDPDGAIDAILNTEGVEPGVLIALLLPAVQQAREAANVVVEAELVRDPAGGLNANDDATIAQTENSAEPVAMEEFELLEDAPQRDREEGFDAPLIAVVAPLENQVYLPMLMR
ncbi:MAG: beta-lactamase family protein [Oscillochloris sp.]|nr:beta-lactamase family protein [Oscillochloris sp.]